MNEYLYGEPSAEEQRDLLSEIDAGELDERYLIKHSSDYGRRTAMHPIRTLRSFIRRFLHARNPIVKPRQADTSPYIVSHSGSPG